MPPQPASRDKPKAASKEDRDVPVICVGAFSGLTGLQRCLPTYTMLKHPLLKHPGPLLAWGNYVGGIRESFLMAAEDTDILTVLL